MKRLFPYSFYFIGAFLFCACTEQKLDPPPVEGLSIDEIRYVGKLHNDILIEAIDSYEPSSESTNGSDFAIALNKTGRARGILTESKVIETVARHGNPTALLKLLNSEGSRYFFQQINAFSATGRNYRDVSKFLDSVFVEAQYELYGHERDAILLLCEVSKNSAYLWMSVDNGGMGYGDILREKLGRGNTLQLRESSCLDLVLAADGAAAASYFTGVGLAILATPGTNAALATYIGWTAAISSGWAYLTSKECGSEE